MDKSIKKLAYQLNLLASGRDLEEVPAQFEQKTEPPILLDKGKPDKPGKVCYICGQEVLRLYWQDFVDNKKRKVCKTCRVL